MTIRITNSSIIRAVQSLEEWGKSVHSQKCKHLWQFLALKQSGANANTWIPHPEANDFAFCDRYLRVRESESPYYDPLDRSFRIASHPHSNLATARKNTFKNRWKAAETKPGAADEWRLAADYLQIFRSNACSVGGVFTPIPLIELAIWLLRGEAWPTNDAIHEVKKHFLRRFNITTEERENLFDTNVPDWATDESVFSAAPDDLALLPPLLERRIGMPDVRRPGSIVTYGSVSPQRLATLLLNGRGQLVLYGPPGTSKTLLAKRTALELLDCDAGELRKTFIDPTAKETDLLAQTATSGGWTIVQFHPSYCYEDFVRGVSPTHGSGSSPSFEVVDRTFARLCRVAEHTSMPIVLIIDEINRGDLARIFGELLYALEYRGEPITIQYATSAGASLVVPRNLYIIATLNSADKSISQIDFALRRRFDFVHCGVDRAVVEQFHSNEALRAKACSLFDLANSAIREGREFGVGHSYFLHSEAEALATSFAFQVAPLLREYRSEGLLTTDRFSLESDDSLDLLALNSFDLQALLLAWISSCSPRKDPIP